MTGDFPIPNCSTCSYKLSPMVNISSCWTSPPDNSFARTYTTISKEGEKKEPIKLEWTSNIGFAVAAYIDSAFVVYLPTAESFKLMITDDGKIYEIGPFDRLEDAQQAALVQCKLLYGED